MNRANFNSYSAYEESKLFNRMLTVGQVLNFCYTIDPNLLDFIPLTKLSSSFLDLVLTRGQQQHFQKFLPVFCLSVVSASVVDPNSQSGSGSRRQK
jgi:hypothetical protein